MTILALDSSGLVASAAVCRDDILLAEYTVNYKKTHSQTLLPMIDEIMKMTELEPCSIDAIAVAAGPGSFTGLRIGSATAKGLGLALNRPLIGVPTVDALACNLYDFTGIVCPIMDARREQVYTGLYRMKEGELEILEPQMVIGMEELTERLNGRGERTIFLGDAVPVYRNILEDRLTIPFCCAPAHLSRQRAGAVAFLASRYYREGKTETAQAHTPVYLRVSQAERERAAREKAERTGISFT